MKKRKRSARNKQHGVALVVGSLLASLGASLGVLPDHVFAETPTPSGSTETASASSAATEPAPVTSAAQQAEYQREALLRGDGSRSVGSMLKGAEGLFTMGAVDGQLSSAERMDEANRRAALLNQGMTLADLDRADAALQAEAAKRAPNDPAAQQQILLALTKARILDYDFQSGSMATATAAGGPPRTTATNAYDMVLHDMAPTAALGKTPIDAETDLAVKMRVAQLQSGMSYQAILDAASQEDATLQAQAAAQAPNEPVAQRQIVAQLKHEQMTQDLLTLTPPADRYALLLTVVQGEAQGKSPAPSALQLETEAVRRLNLMNSGMGYGQTLTAESTPAQQAEYQREALLRGDGSRSVGSMLKGAKGLFTMDAVDAQLSSAERMDEANRRAALLNQGMTLADLDRADAALQAEAAKRAPNDPAAQQQILLALTKSRILDFDFQSGSMAAAIPGGGGTRIVATSAYEMVLHDVAPTAVMGKMPIPAEVDLEVKARVAMLQSGMSYQSIQDASSQQNAAWQAQAVAQAPNDPTAQAQIVAQLKHQQLTQDLWKLTPPADRYELMLTVVQGEAKGKSPAPTALQLETEAVKRLSLMNAGMNYEQAMNMQPTAAQQTEYQREALLRGDGSRSVGSMQKGTEGLFAMANVPLSSAERVDEANRRAALINQGMTLADLDRADAALQAEAARRAPNDPAAQQQILLELTKARILDYDFQSGSMATTTAAGGPPRTVATNAYDMVLHDMAPTAALGKTPIDAETDLAVKMRVAQLQSGMSYQAILDAAAQEDAALQAQAAAQAPNEPAAQAQILAQLKHNQLVHDLWQLTPPADRYALLLMVVSAEMKNANPPLTALQLETEAVKRLSLMNSGLSYVQVLAVAEADRRAMLAAAAAAAAAAAQRQAGAAKQEAKQETGQQNPQSNTNGDSTQTSSGTVVTNSATTNNAAGGTSSGVAAIGTPPPGPRIFICN